jgi:hypothetical protein
MEKEGGVGKLNKGGNFFLFLHSKIHLSQNGKRRGSRKIK